MLLITGINQGEKLKVKGSSETLLGSYLRAHTVVTHLYSKRCYTSIPFNVLMPFILNTETWCLPLELPITE